MKFFINRTSCVFLLTLFIGGIIIGIHHSVFAAGEPVVTERFVEDIMPTSARPTAEVTDEGSAPVIGVWIQYGTTDSYGTEQQRFNLNELTIPGVIDASLTGLTCDTTYHYRFRVRNNALLDGYSPDATFTTSPCYLDNTISHWTLNEGSGIRSDSVGENDLSPVNSPTSVTGYINDGVNATISGSKYLTIPDNASLSTGGETSFTISLWVKLLSKTGTQVFVSKYGTGGEYAVYFENSFDRFVFSTYAGEQNYFIKADDLGSPEIGVWYHIIATHNAETNTNSILVNDGVADTLTSVPEHVDSTAAFRIGAFGSTPNYFADAVIDDVRFAKSAYVLPTPLPLFAGGDGTELDPYQISTCQQLQDINQDLDAHYVLINNIDCTTTATWNGNEDEWEGGSIGGTLINDSYVGVTNNGYFGFEPIGQDDYNNQSGSGFTGSFDGNEYTISDLWIFRKDAYNNGLFGYASSATIQNTRLLDARIVGGDTTGGFVGYAGGTVLNNLINENGMVRAYLSYNGGGIAGSMQSESSLDNAQVISGNVHGSGNVIGGLVGYVHQSTISDSTTSANVDGGEYVGGAFGQVHEATITNIDATGNVVANLDEGLFAKSGRYSGGFAGSINNSQISDSYATGSVSSEGNYTGGFVGLIEGVSLIEDSYATGNVSSDANTVGGFAGAAFCGPSFTRVYATGNVSTVGNNVGGFVGSDGCEGPGATYNQVSASGLVTGTDRVGGFVGESYFSDFTNVYTSGNVTGADVVGGFGGYIYHPKITNAYARGSVLGDTNTGGFIGIHYVGFEDRMITNSFFDTQTSGYENAIGDGDASGVTGKTSSEMKTSTTFTDAGWDFDDVWEMNGDNNGYPYFTWENPPSDTYALLTLDPESVTDTAVILRGQVTSGEFPPGGLGFAVSPTPFESLEESPWLIGPADDFGTTPNDDGIYTLDLNLFFATENYLELNGLTCNTTYYYLAIGYTGFGEEGLVFADNTVSFTTSPCDNTEPEPTPQPRRRVIGYMPGSTTFSAPLVTPSSTTLGTPGVCTPDQTLTQNLRSGARNGRFHPYTKAIVTEAKILQAHLNRLGFNSGPVDGILGPISDGAIKRMQTFLKTIPDGFVGPITRGLLNTSCGVQN